MEQIHAQLIAVMKELVGHHRELLALEREKITLVVEQDWKHLEERVEQSRTVLQKIDDAEKRRITVIGALGGDISSGPQTLSELAERIPDTCVGEVMRLGEMLCSLMLELKNLNSRSEQLIWSSLEVVDFTLALLSGASSNGKTYSGDGEERAGGREHPSLVFDVKA
jgi:flagellar biosynthesis/type III secretory pathway chaperone